MSKSGPSVSVGPRGAKVTAGPRGTRTTVGIPGTGLFYTTASKTGSRPASNSIRRQSQTPSLGFLKRLVTPDDHEALIDAFVALSRDDEPTALKHLRRAVHLVDGAFLAGCLSLKRGRYADSVRYLKTASQSPAELDRLFSQYGIDATWELPISDDVVARIKPSLRGSLLALVEAYQRLNRWQDAVDTLRRLRRLEPNDIIIKLSFAELLMTYPSSTPKICRRVVRLADGVANESSAHAALMLYKGRALRQLGMPEAAYQVLTAALRRRKDRSVELLQALRYQRALASEELGNHSKARSDLERIYSEQSDYEDVADRLGL